MFPLPPGLTTSLFGGIMLVVEILNSVGVSLSANPSASKATHNLGAILTKVSIALQLAILLAFLALAGWLHADVQTQTCLLEQTHQDAIAHAVLQQALILIRCNYRLVEHLGQTRKDFRDQVALRSLSPLLRYELWFYTFKPTLMLLNSILWNVFHAGRYLPAQHNVLVGRDGEETTNETTLDDDRGAF